MPNRLNSASSPYLLQHAHNPVDWYPWGPEALERARREDKPIFLSIGYAACHWCHVMAHESFEDPAIAALMNQSFVNIKVDREERPDLDSLYMSAVVALTGQGGWPMSLFLTPSGQPFYGGTYFPPARRYNMPSFSEVLHSIARLWQEDRPAILASGEKITAYLDQQQPSLSPASQLDPQALQKAAYALAQSYDWKFGGWGSAPRFPMPMAIEFLLLQASRGDKLARDIAAHALHAMAKGGMYDVLGGGFARYSTDDRWLVPHFEKMLYDNAQLARAYLHAYLLTGEPAFKRVCDETLAFVQRELSHPLGGFYSSLDADSEGQEGKYYRWTLAEIKQLFPDPAEFEFFRLAYALTEAGNHEGGNVLQQVLSTAELAEQFHLPVAEIRPRLERLHARLLQQRSTRVRPATDDKVLTSWNALMLTAFAEAGRYLHNPSYTNMAMRSGRFLATALYQDAQLFRSWRDGVAVQPAFLEDYAALILGLLSLYQSDPQTRWFTLACSLTEHMLARFRDPSGGFFDTSQDSAPLILRPRDLQDNATPSGGSLAAQALQHMAAYTGRSDWAALAEADLASIQQNLSRYPTAFANWLCALDFAAGPVSELAILIPPQAPPPADLLQVAWNSWRPRLVVASSPYPSLPGAPALLDERLLLDGQPTAYLCQGFVCRQPVTSPADLARQLGDAPLP